MSAESSKTSGIQKDELDAAVRPQDDLFRHVNGKWIGRTEIPSDKARYGSFYLLAEEAERAVREIIEEASSAEPGTEERKFGDVYASFMDEKRIQQLGARPLKPLLEEVNAISTTGAFLATAGRFERRGTSGFFQLFVDNDPGDPERYLVFFEQAGLGLPDESYYREEKFAEIRTKYVEYLTKILGLAGLSMPAERAKRIYAVETDLAAQHWDNVRSRDSEATYNLTTWPDVAKASLAKGLDLEPWLDGIDAPHSSFREIVIRQPSFLESLPELITQESLEAWKDWMSWQVIRSNAGYLSDDFVNANFDFYGKTLTGTPELRARWKRGVSLVEGSLGEAVGRAYVERHFPKGAKAAMDILVANLIEAYRESITNLDWMTPETRARAIEKLDKFTPKIGYPVKWRDYSSLTMNRPGFRAVFFL